MTNTYNTGITIYFIESAMTGKTDPNTPLISSAVISKAGSKFIRFSQVNDRTSEHVIKEYRYNIANQTVEKYWGRNEWRQIATQIFNQQWAAARYLEQQLLAECLLHRPNRLAISAMPLTLLETLTSYMEISAQLELKLEALRQIKKIA
jgi:hypothetical protein